MPSSPADATGSGPARADTRTVPATRSRLLLALMLAFALGWAASIAWASGAPLRLVDRAAGTVSVVNASGAAFCLDPDGGGRQRCGVAYHRPDAPQLRVGDHVSVAVGLLRSGESSVEIFVIEAVE